MARIGYGRVSREDQQLQSQLDQLNAAGCERIFTDHGVSGAKASRPQLDACLEYLRKGDVLVVTKLDRLGRSVSNLIELVSRLGEQGIDLVVLHQGIDTTTAAGKFMFHVLASVAEFERDLIRDRTLDGLAAARAKGNVGGRRPTVTQDVLDLALARKARGESPAKIAKELGVGRSTLYRALAEVNA
jgi:DNA invertase Pin-like site-specific DNA recombinase